MSSSTAYLRSDTSEWLKFFESAGIPAKIALQYSMLFADHRIHKDQLGDINKTILNEVGITAVGDVLAIVKHAKLMWAEEAEQMTFETIKQQQTTKPSSHHSHSHSTPWNVTKSVAITRTTEEPAPAKRRKPAPDHDVVYTKKYPSGSTARSKLILQKAASMELKKVSSPQQSVFDRLGMSLSREGLMNKNVKFASGTKEGNTSSPEVSSTTRDDFPTLESDKLIRKQSALVRLGPKSNQKNTSFDPDSLTGTRITIIGGQRKLLTPKRSPAVEPRGVRTVPSGSRTIQNITRTVSTGSRTIPRGLGGVKSRLGQRSQTNLDSDEEDAEKFDVFSRLGKRKSF